MRKTIHRLNETAPDSLHRVWKFKSIKLLVDGMFSLPEIYLMDLRRKNSVSYIDKDGKQKDHPLEYKIIDNAIVIQSEDPNDLNNKDNIVKVIFKITEVASTKLKLIVTANHKKDENIDEDIMELVFEGEK